MTHSRLAGYGHRGPIWINRHIPETYRGISVRPRVRTHEETERWLRLVKGLSQKKAHKLALKAEHRGLTLHQIRVYEGFLGSVARHYPCVK